MTKIPRTIKIVVTLGLLPIFLGSIAIFEWPMVDKSINIFFLKCSILYASLILSFLGGCLFGFECLRDPEPNKLWIWLAITPSIWSLIALQIPNFSASILAVGFLLVYEFDRKAHSAGMTPSWWLSVRFPLTTIVILNLAIIGFYYGG
jgi:hypothetical protein